MLTFLNSILPFEGQLFFNESSPSNFNSGSSSKLQYLSILSIDTIT